MDNQTIFCTNCGKPSAAGAAFCRYCGTPMSAPVVEADPNAQAVLDMVLDMNPDDFTPIAALNFLYELKKRATAND